MIQELDQNWGIWTRLRWNNARDRLNAGTTDWPETRTEKGEEIPSKTRHSYQKQHKSSKLKIMVLVLEKGLNWGLKGWKRKKSVIKAGTGRAERWRAWMGALFILWKRSCSTFYLSGPQKQPSSFAGAQQFSVTVKNVQTWELSPSHKVQGGLIIFIYCTFHYMKRSRS